MSILSVGQSALNAAQIGVATTGHNIANASTPGYSRQVVLTGAVGGQNLGNGFIGGGTEVTNVSRVYNEFLSGQVLRAQTSSSQLSTYTAQIKQIDNLLADQNAGLSPALQDFFTGVQNLSSDPNSAASRQALLSSGEALAARFQSLSGQISDVRQGLNGQINTSVSTINSYATQIANLNDAIEKAQAGGSSTANDLLDKRDLAVLELSKEVKVSVVKQGESYNVYIGNGQGLVVGTRTSTLFAANSPTDPTRTQIGIRTSSGATTLLDEKSLPGGNLGALFEFRSTSLESAQNSLGRVATSLAAEFNAQHALGQTQTGGLGGNFFNAGAPQVSASSRNSTASTASVTAVISDASRLTVSDYRVQVVAATAPATVPGYRITRLADGAVSNLGGPVAPATSATLTVDGVDISVSGTPVVNDEFLIRPTANGAAGFSMALTNRADIAVGAPVITASVATNTGTGAITPATVTATTALPNVTLAYNATTQTLSGFPTPLSVTVTANGTSTTYASGTTVPYTAGATIAFSGVNFALSGAPANGDTFKVGPNVNGVGDNRNALLLGKLQSKNTLDGASTTFQGAYSQLVSSIGNKTRELQITGDAASSLLQQSITLQQSESGVNLDEEAGNLLRYQQAYQAAGKLIQTASTLFGVLLALGGS
ncbi:MAG: flagellar hook-associated protein FlgK [Pseudomonadota bacterium]